MTARAWGWWSGGQGKCFSQTGRRLSPSSLLNSCLRRRGSAGPARNFFFDPKSFKDAHVIFAVRKAVLARRRYHYEDPTHPHHLTGITDERGIRYATWAYDAQGRATLSEHAGGVERVSFTYNPDGTTSVLTGNGASRTYAFKVNHGKMDVTSVSGDLCPTCPNGDKKARSYTTDGYLSAFTDWSDSITRFGSFDATGQSGCQTEGIALADTTDTSVDGCAFDPVVSPEARRTDYTYDPRFHRKAATVTVPSVFTP